MLGFCFPPVLVTSMSVLFLHLIRKGLRLKRVPRFTKITVCPQMLLYCLSPPSLPHGSLPPPSPLSVPSCLPLLPLPWCLSPGRQGAPGEANWHLSCHLCHPLAPMHPPAAADHRCRAPAGRLHPLHWCWGTWGLLFWCKGACSRGISSSNIPNKTPPILSRRCRRNTLNL